MRNNDIGLQRDEFLCGSLPQLWVFECPPANVDFDVAALDPPKLLKSLPECGYVSLKFWVALRMCHEHANTPHTVS